MEFTYDEFEKWFAKSYGARPEQMSEYDLYRQYEVALKQAHEYKMRHHILTEWENKRISAKHAWYAK